MKNKRVSNRFIFLFSFSILFTNIFLYEIHKEKNLFQILGVERGNDEQIRKTIKKLIVNKNINR